MLTQLWVEAPMHAVTRDMLYLCMKEDGKFLHR